ncbi:hypothetical protein [Rhodococcus sp. P14]|uniref:hypothetical protein n=1 Tax=Rhodococcus sp. P14 TaxID=450821 RepID=UPI0012F6B9BA|nr:hypothetical protein [Rhodococcus sp. P14]
MKTSKLCANLSTWAFVLSALSLFLMCASSLYYLMSTEWMVLTGANWFFLALFLGAAGIVFSVIASGARKSEAKAEREEAERRQAEQAKRASEEAYRQEQDRLITRVTRANQSATEALGRLPMHLEEAKAFLHQSEVDWRERVYNPFWTSLEGCALKLKAFQDDIVYIHSMADQYSEAAARYDGVVPPFSVTDVSVSAMQSYKTIYDAVAKATRRAMGDIEFANIYESWHGNRIMAAGFSDLRSALSEMSVSISSQISSLHSSLGNISAGIGSLTGAVNSQSSILNGHASISASQNAELIRASKVSAQREKDAAKRLWNIEHGHKSAF